MDSILNEIASATQSPLGAALILLKYLGIPTFLIFGFFGGRILWLDWRQSKFAAKKEYTILAVDIPKLNEQSPKAVENMFDQIAGAHSSPSRWDKWVEGYFQPKFSFEIVSIEGYVQFLIHTEKVFRDLVEAAIYAQYPDAEITEVEDYVDISPKEFPSETQELWGAEFIESKPWPYPIQTYPFFEHSLSQEFKDPMAALMEIMSSVGRSENIWIQYVVTMEGFDWVNKCKDEINKLTGKKSAAKKGFFASIIEGWTDELTAQISGGPRAEVKKENGKDEPVMFKLTPGELDQVKAIEAKMGKIGFSVKMRFIYFADKERFSKARSVSATVGALKQFAGPYNGLKPETKHTVTKKFLFFKEKRLARRQKNILNAYKSRSDSLGVANGFILNSEELATLYHFPISTVVRAPLVKKVEAKKGEPPSNIPMGGEEIEVAAKEEIYEEAEEVFSEEDLQKAFSREKERPFGESHKEKPEGNEPPSNLPIV